MLKTLTCALAGAGAFVLGSTGAAAACSPSDIEIRSWSHGADDEYAEYFLVVGELVNHCDIAIGVKLQLLTRDETGQVIDFDEWWPASVKNIPADARYGFKWHMSVWRNQHAKTWHLSVIKVKRW